MVRSETARVCLATSIRGVALLSAALLTAHCGSTPTGPPPPSLRVLSISPVLGSTTGGSTVTVVGTDFGSDATLTVGGVPATSVAVQGTTTITALVGVRATAGPADVVVTSGGRTASLGGGFTFVAPSGGNVPPVISGFRSIGSRLRQPSGFADVDETITVVASVTDAETPESALTFEWSGGGAFAGSGPAVAWRVPSSLSSTPAPVTVGLKVFEAFVEGAVTHRSQASGSYVVDVHDSQKEILDMGEDFLTLFSRTEVGTNDVLHNFSTTCDGGRGRADERNDVDANRAAYIEDFSKFRLTRVGPASFNFGGRCPFRARPADACSAYRVHWEATKRSTGSREVADGIDHVTAVLENGRWRLCHSDFDGTVTNLTTGLTQHVVW